MAVNKVKLSIGGTEYSILAEDDVNYVRELGRELDRGFANIMKANKTISTTQAAVLLALDYADESRKATATADRLREQIKDYLDDASDAKSKADWARHEAETLKRELENAKLEVKRLKAELKAVMDSVTE